MNKDNITLLFPGREVVLEEEEIAKMISEILEHMATSFFEANISLELCLFNLQRDLSSSKSKYNGEIPSEILERQKYLYAKSYILSLSNIQDLFDALIKINSKLRLPEEIGVERRVFKKKFPFIADFRNSLVHLGDRIRKENKTKEISVPKIDPKSTRPTLEMTSSGLKIGNRLLGKYVTDIRVINNELYSFGGFIDRKFHILLKNGELGEFELNLENLLTVRNCIQNILNSFNWDGREEKRPRMI